MRFNACRERRSQESQVEKPYRRTWSRQMLNIFGISQSSQTAIQGDASTGLARLNWTDTWNTLNRPTSTAPLTASCTPTASRPHQGYCRISARVGGERGMKN